MARTLDSGFATDIALDLNRVALLIQADLPSGVTRLWTGPKSLSYDSQTWQPVPGILRVGSPAESLDTAAPSLTLEFSLPDGAQLDDILDGTYWGAEIKTWLVTLDDDLAVTGIQPWFFGYLDSDEIDIKPGETRLNITAGNRLADQVRQRKYRYTAADQKALYPDTVDKGFEFVQSQQELELSWGE